MNSLQVASVEKLRAEVALAMFSVANAVSATAAEPDESDDMTNSIQPSEAPNHSGMSLLLRMIKSGNKSEQPADEAP